MAGCGTSSSLPLGPSTLIFVPSTATFTPAGTAIGCFPIRDMAFPSCKGRVDDPSGKFDRSSPEPTEHLAADPLGPRLAIAHDAPTRAQDADAESLQHRLEVLVAL